MKFLTLSLAIYLLFSAFSCTKDKDKIDWTPVPDSIKDKNGNIDQSKIDNTKKQKPLEDVTFTTSDKKEISGSFYFQDTKKNDSQPLVILVHQFNQTREQWQGSFIDSLLNAGYKVLTYDIRGHGKSAKQNGKLEDLLSDPLQAPSDIKAVTDWAKKQKGIDSSRISVIGTSIGGNVALYAALNLGVKVPVAISNGKGTFEAYTGYN
ncbi:MAG: alpha/beta fold hydrolase, partial [Ignavibacteria bacterium]